MKKTLLTIFLIFFFGNSFSQDKQLIETKDIDNFWLAFDKLKYTTNEKDSIKIIQTEYIDQSTNISKSLLG